MPIRLGLICLGLALVSTRLLAAEVQAFSPDGKAKDVRQVRAKFSEAMVPIGQPLADSPFDIKCAEKGKARWIDDKNWVFDFERDLPRGVSCVFTLKESAKSLAGKILDGKKSFQFQTGEAVLSETRPYEGSEISEEQVFLLSFDGAVSPVEVHKKLSVVAEGVQNKLDFEILPPKITKPIVHTRAFKAFAPKLGRSAYFIRVKQRFASAAKVQLRWEGDERRFDYRVQAPFRAEFTCERENAKAPCNPITALGIRFSAAVPNTLLREILLKGPDGKLLAPTEPKEAKPGQSGFFVQFPNPLAARAAYSVILPKNLKDISERSLVNAKQFPLAIKTAAYSPLVKFASNFGILETGVAVLPLTVRAVEPQLESAVLDIKTVQAANEEHAFLKFVDSVLRNAGEESSKNASVLEGTGLSSNAEKRKLTLPGGGKDFEVVGIPFKKPGFYIVEVQSPKLGKSLIGEATPMYVSTGVLVTNLAVHLKWGRGRSLVWVTELATGKPAAGADVAIYNCRDEKLFAGRTDANGVVSTDQIPWKIEACDNGYVNYRLLATAQKGDDRSFVLDIWNQGIEPYRFNVNQSYFEDVSQPIAHAILSRTLLRAGETVHIKHVLRGLSNDGFRFAKPEETPVKLVITHTGSDEKNKFDLKFDASGIAETEWKIPEAAKLGTYSLRYLKAGEEEPQWSSPSGGSFRVEEFKVPILKGIIQGPAEAQIRPASVPVAFSLSFLSGGPAAGEKITIRHHFNPSPAGGFADYSDFAFGQNKLEEKTVRSSSEDDWGGEESAENSELANAKKFTTGALTLDKAGAAKTDIKMPVKLRVSGTLDVEMEYKDPNGEVDTISKRIQVWSADRFVGIRADGWEAKKDKVKMQAVVVDLKGKPQAGVKVAIDQYLSEYNSYRKKLIGGFFAYETSRQIKKLGSFCKGMTDEKGLFTCEAPAAKAGGILFQAHSSDSKGRESFASREVYVYDKDQMWFDVADNDRMDLIPESKSVEPGSTARFQVRMPFRSATALVAVEREGVLETFVTELSGEKPEVTVPIKDAYAPNVFVSVLAVRGRVSDPAPTALVDLGKPAFKLGITSLKVGWSGHQLKVKAKTDKDDYQTRGRAKLKIKVEAPGGQPLPKDAEVAVAVVDEALLELMPNNSWDVLNAMMQERPYDVRIATAAMNVIGKRHFGKKALPSGGGGGHATTRELFDTLLLWKARVPLKKNGEAELEIPLNDSISKFRVAVVATAGAQFFGTGETGFTTSKDLQILPGLPQIVREGDELEVHALIRNTTRAALEAKASVAIEGLPSKLEERKIKLGAQSSEDVHWRVTIPNSVPSGDLKIRLAVAGPGGNPADAAKIAVKVFPAVPVRTIQATLLQVSPAATLPVAMPKEAIKGKGGLAIDLQPTLGTSLGEVVEYMKTYPYSCLEQRTSKSIVLEDAKAKATILRELPSYMDGYGLLKYWPVMNSGSDILTAYFLSVTSEAGWELPVDLRDQMLGGLQAFVEGKIPDQHAHFTEAVETRMLQLRKLAAIEALSRFGEGREALLSTLQLTPQTWPTSGLLDWWQILKRWPKVDGREARLAEAERMLRSRLDFRGTRMGFSSEEGDFWTWLMVSPDLNAARLLLGALPEASWRDDLPKLLRGTMDRRKIGLWFNTTANTWNALALRKFAKEFEKASVAGTTKASLEANAKSFDWKASPPGGKLELPWPSAGADLKLNHEGTGAPWATVEARVALPLKAPEGNGLSIRREISAVQQKTKNVWSRGDLAKVKLTISAQADNAWLVVRDPVPAGAMILGSGLGRDSALLSAGGKHQGAWPVFEERAADSYRAYYEYVAKGEVVVEYTMRLNQAGKFSLPSTHVEAMYAPDVYADAPNSAIEVKE